MTGMITVGLGGGFVCGERGAIAPNLIRDSEGSNFKFICDQN